MTSAVAVTSLNCNVVCSFEGLTKEQWQELRNTHYGLGHYTIGGSDVGVILGVNKYKDTPQLFLEKKGIVDIPVNNEAIEWGNIMEPIIADKFAKENAHIEVIDYPFLLQHPVNEFAVANIDKLIYDFEEDEYGVLEIKTASEYVKSDWDDGAIPPSYYAQLQHYFYVTGLRWGYFAVLIGGNKFHQIRVERSDDFINGMVFQEEIFIDRLDLDQAPEITGSESSLNVLNHLYPSALNEKEVVKLDDEYGDLIAKRQKLKKQIAETEEELKTCENKVKEFLGDNKLGAYTGGGMLYKVSWGNVKGRTSFDDKSFKVDYPELYEQYIKQGEPYRQFRVTEKVVG